MGWCITKWDVFSILPLPELNMDEPEMITGISFSVKIPTCLRNHDTNLQPPRFENFATFLTAAGCSCLKYGFTSMIWKHSKTSHSTRRKSGVSTVCEYPMSPCGRPPWLLVPFLHSVRPRQVSFRTVAFKQRISCYVPSIEHPDV